MRSFKQFALLILFIFIIGLTAGCKKGDTNQNIKKDSPVTNSSSEKTAPPELKYLGHSSIKLKTTKGTVIYIDPYAGDDYNDPADLVLVTHSHSDHANVDRVKLKSTGKIITYKEAIKDNTYQSFDLLDINVSSVAAYNENHPKNSCVGYIVEFDGIKLYHAGDTSKISEMDQLAAQNITFALLPMDGIYNMGPKEAVEVAKVIKAKHYIPIHTGPDGIFDEKNISEFNVDNRIILKPGDAIKLKE